MAVYFIQAGEGGPVKIGKADDPRARMSELQVAHHVELSLMRVIEGDLAVEQWLHRHYADLHLRGEWFRFSECMMAIEPPCLTATGHVAIIELWPTAKELGVDIDTSEFTVRGWKRRRSIPSHTWEKLLRAARGRNIPLSVDSLLAGQVRRSARPKVAA